VINRRSKRALPMTLLSERISGVLMVRKSRPGAHPGNYVVFRPGAATRAPVPRPAPRATAHAPCLRVMVSLSNHRNAGCSLAGTPAFGHRGQTLLAEIGLPPLVGCGRFSDAPRGSTPRCDCAVVARLTPTWRHILGWRGVKKISTEGLTGAYQWAIVLVY
jgi:hypothetical protein